MELDLQSPKDCRHQETNVLRNISFKIVLDVGLLRRCGLACLAWLRPRQDFVVLITPCALTLIYQPQYNYCPGGLVSVSLEINHYR